jgi:precorrin-3B methylase
MEYLVYAIIGIGLGLSTSSIITRNSKRVQNAQDDLEAKKAWVTLVSNRNQKQSLGEKNDRRNQKR